jgi:hypothetical protein
LRTSRTAAPYFIGHSDGDCRKYLHHPEPSRLPSFPFSFDPIPEFPTPTAQPDPRSIYARSPTATTRYEPEHALSPSRSSSPSAPRLFPLVILLLLLFPSGAGRGGQADTRRRSPVSEPRRDVVDEPARSPSGSIRSTLRADHHGSAAQLSQRDGAHCE